LSVSRLVSNPKIVVETVIAHDDMLALAPTRQSRIAEKSIGQH